MNSDWSGFSRETVSVSLTVSHPTNSMDGKSFSRSMYPVFGSINFVCRSINRASRHSPIALAFGVSPCNHGSLAWVDHLFVGRDNLW